MRAVVAAGMTYIDTADVYGPHSNEELPAGWARVPRDMAEPSAAAA